MRTVIITFMILTSVATTVWSNEAACQAAANDAFTAKRKECKSIADKKEQTKCTREASKSLGAALKACEPPIIVDKKGNITFTSHNGKFIVNVPKGSGKFEGRADAMYGSHTRFSVPLAGKNAAAKSREIAKLTGHFGAKRITIEMYKPDGNGGYNEKKVAKRAFAIKKFSASMAEDGSAMMSGLVREKIKVSDGQLEVGAIVYVKVKGSVTNGKLTPADDATEAVVEITTALPEQ